MNRAGTNCRASASILRGEQRPLPGKVDYQLVDVCQWLVVALNWRTHFLVD
jgi:hypothetical protein